MSDTINRAESLINTIEREDAVSFYAVKGVLRDCIRELTSASTEHANCKSMARRLWIELNGDDEYFEDAIRNHHDHG